nr:MAG TPA: hypothetical protein [Caudoviricetes sp.]
MLPASLLTRKLGAVNGSLMLRCLTPTGTLRSRRVVGLSSGFCRRLTKGSLGARSGARCSNSLPLSKTRQVRWRMSFRRLRSNSSAGLADRKG